MKLFLALCLVFGVAFGNSVNYYGWPPHKEFVFRYESSVMANIPEIRRDQKAGLKLTSTVRVQTLEDYTIMVKFENCRLTTVNGEERREDREEPIPEPFKSHLEKAFKVHMKRGVIETLFVDQDEPVAVTNIKKALLSNLNLDVVASRRSSIESNRLEVQPEEPISPLGQSYFTVREKSLHGDCETSYTIHPISEAEAKEIEEKIEEEEKERNAREHLQGGLSRGREVCQGKQYFQITKTRDFENCVETPVYQSWSGIRAKCDPTKGSCKDLMNHISATNYIVCGRDMSEFVIRKSVTENTILANLAWNTEEKFFNKARVSLELLREEAPSGPFPMPSSMKQIKSLTFEYPERTFGSSQSLALSEAQKVEEEQRTGIKPQLPKPDLTSRPKMLVPVRMDKDELTRQVAEEMKKVASEIFESPESCSSKGDVAGHLSVIARALRPLSLDELKHVERTVLQNNQEPKLRNLFYDVISMMGTNPAVMFIKEKLQHTSSLQHNGVGNNAQAAEITEIKRSYLLQGAIRAIKTPTKELLSELVKLVKEELKQNMHQETHLYSVALVQMSNLLYKACVNPTSRNVEYPTKIYGEFCNEHAPVVVDQWIPFLEQELENKSNLPEQIKLTLIAALGKIGHAKAVKPLAKIISEEQVKPMVRSIAVYSLKRVAKLEPVVVRPILLSIIDNPAEATEVRIAAIAILPWSQPSTAELQKIAVRSWFEPSKQVASFIYSTFKSLEQTETPLLKIVGQKVRPLIHLVKPFKYGYQYSKNWNSARFVDYLKLAISHTYEWTNTRDSMIPNRFSDTVRVIGGSYELVGPSFTVYTQGMDTWMDKFFYFTNQPKASAQVSEGLRMITEKLKIESRKTRLPEIFAQASLLEYESSFYFDENKIMAAVEKIGEEMRSNPQYLNEEKHFDYADAYKVVDIEVLGPCDAGFPIFLERNIPVVLAVKGSVKVESEQSSLIPTELKVKFMPVINVKFEANLGVISPFTSEFIGTGIDMAMHLALPLDMSLKRKEANQVSLSLRVPEEVNREIETIHVYVKPYTVKKSLHKIQPVSKASDLKVILSGEPLKKLDKEIGHALEISAQIKYESDNKFVDLYSYWEKIRQHNYYSLIHTFPLVSSLRMSSYKILFNPQQSQTKELSLTMSLMTAEKMPHQSELMVKLPGSEIEAEASVHDMHLIREVCDAHFRKYPAQLAKCIVELTALEAVTTTTEEICRVHPFPKCQRLVAICKRAEEICETERGITTGNCQTTKDQCLHSILNLKLVHRTFAEMGNQGRITAVQMEASIKSRFGQKGLKTGFSFGIHKNPVSNQVKFVFNFEVKTPSAPVYEVKLTSEATMPRVNNRWNKEHLLEEALSLALNGKVEYGFEQSSKRSVHVESKIVKSEEQKRAVRMSPEYKQCEEEEKRDSVLSPVCEKLRHQAGSVDRIEATLKFPRSIVETSWFTKVAEAVKAYYFIQLREEQSSEAPTDLETLRLIANVSRVGEEAQFETLYNGRRFLIENIRLPEVARDLLPISMRNELSYNLYQKMSRDQIPSSCAVEPKSISTFDNKTYMYEMNSCEHLLFKDCSNKFPVAITAKNLANGQAKMVKILSGMTKIEMIPEASGQEIKIEADIEGQKEVIRVMPGAFITKRHNGKVVLEIKRYQDNVYLVILPRESLWVLFDGKRIEISAPQMLRYKSCGLCGDLNGENTADLKTPRKCIMSRPRFAAYSYMIKDNSCPGVPAHDQSRYEKELQECVRERIIPTPVQYLASKLASKASLKKSGSPVKPLISVHLVDEKPKSTGKVCISKQKIQLCAKSSPVEVGQPKPVEVRRKRVQYVCFEKNTVYGKQMIQRAKAGESLGDELMTKPVSYSKTEYEPVRCMKASSAFNSSRRL